MTEKLLKMDLQYFSEKTDEAIKENEPEQVESVKEENKPEIKEGAAEDVKTDDQAQVNITELAEKIAALTTEKDTLENQLKATTEQLSAKDSNISEKETEATKASEKAETYEKALETVVAEKSKAIPEDIAALMPEGISVTEKLAWLEKAAAVKVETPEKETEVIQTIGQPTPVADQLQEQADLPVAQKMSNYFSEFFGK